jgi:hypothetical protein
MFAAQSHDFNYVAAGSDASVRIKIENKYVQDVAIASVTTSCGCTIAKMVDNKLVLKSRETAELEISIDTVRHNGEKNTHVSVTFNSPQFATMIIPIHVYIRRDIVVTPGAANFMTIDQGAEKSQKLNIQYAGRADWRITGVESTDPNITAVALETNRAAGNVTYDLNVAIKPSMPVGNFRTQVYLLTDDLKSPKVPVLVEGKVDPDVYITNPTVSLGMLAPGEKKTVSVIVRSKKPITIQGIECASNREIFKTLIPKEAKLIHVIPITVVAPADAGALQEEFTMKVSGREEYMTFKAYGQITGK